MRRILSKSCLLALIRFIYHEPRRPLTILLFLVDGHQLPIDNRNRK
jgi:hypothetical protein